MSFRVNPGVNGKIRQLLAIRLTALYNKDNVKLHQKKRDLQQHVIRKAKQKYAAKVEKTFDCSCTKVWKSLNNLLKLTTQNPACYVPPEDLNIFYNRFDEQPKPPTLISSTTDPLELVTVGSVSYVLHGLHVKKRWDQMEFLVDS